MTSPTHMWVLVVDDEEVIADTLTMILNGSGFEARAAYSGEMAISAWPSTSTRTL
jgi:DNA-binding response OmpR family regulator